MSIFSTTVAVTREAYMSSIIQSFSTHFIIIFSKYRCSIDVVHIIYYSPTDIEHSRVTNNLRIISKCISMVYRDVSTIWQFVRLYSPVLDSNVLSGYLSLNTKTQTFIQILIYQFRHYPVSKSNVNNYTSDTWGGHEGSDNSNFIIGITITLKGRIPTESIKPRKTVQSMIVGSHYSTLPVKQTSISTCWGGVVEGRHYIMSNSSSTTNSNNELGSYTVSVRVTGINFLWCFL